VQEVNEHTFVDSRAVEDEIKVYAFTFGQNHIWPLTGTSLRKNFVRLQGTFDGTRNEMNRRFGNRWSMQYLDDAKFRNDVERFELAELSLEFPDNVTVFS
jgi:hypothetical protein